VEKIGTGEGAQAYGHGLYFSEAEDVAKGYRERLSPQTVWPLNPDEFPDDMADITGYSPQAIAAAKAALKLYSGDALKAVGELDQLHGAGIGGGVLGEATKVLRSFNTKARPGGHMYEVELNADPSVLLDWDAPLRNQEEVVSKLGLIPHSKRDAAYEELHALGDKLNLDPMQGKDEWEMLFAPSPENQPVIDRIVELRNGLSRNPDGLTGQQLWNQTVKSWGGIPEPRQHGWFHAIKNGPARAAEEFRSKGIPGIKYFDGFSRGAGEGTRNYAIWDDSIINILRRYGLPLTSAGVATLAAALNDQQETA
jgi:hypothetical protein